MTERERLIELLQNTPVDCTGCRGVGTIADYLIENGVIVPTLRVGDTVWVVYKLLWSNPCEKFISEFVVKSISIYCNSKGVWTKKFRIRKVINGKTVDVQKDIKLDDIGKTVYLTKEDAEKALSGEK